MAFVLADDSTLARDLWPDNKGRLVSDSGDASSLPSSRLLPREYEALCAWMCVDPCGIDTPATAWVQPQPGQEDDRTEVTVRFQGFVQSISFGMLGNWNGTAQGAPKAMQTLTLVSGGCTDAFSPQLEALDNIMELVQKFLAREVVNTNNGGKMEFKRRVFHKVRPTEATTRGFSVPFAEDPVGRARKIDHMWSIRHRIDAGSQDASGRIRRENPVLIRSGDFVDVAVNIQTVSLRLPRGKRGVEVMFVPQAIVKLVSSQEAMMLMKTIAEEHEFLEGVADTSTSRVDTGFKFEPSEDMDE